MSNSKLIKTGDALLSFPQFKEPKAFGDGEPVYSAALVFLLGPNGEKNDTVAQIEAAVVELAKAKWGDKAPLLLKSNTFWNPLQPGEPKGYPEGSIYVNAKKRAKMGTIGLVHPYRDPSTGKAAVVADEDILKVFYPGAIVRASIGLYAFDFQGMKKGVGVGLYNVQKLRDGPRLDNHKKAEDEFEALEELQPADLSDIGGQ